MLTQDEGMTQRTSTGRRASRPDFDDRVRDARRERCVPRPRSTKAKAPARAMRRATNQAESDALKHEARWRRPTSGRRDLPALSRRRRHSRRRRPFRLSRPAASRPPTASDRGAASSRRPSAAAAVVISHRAILPERRTRSEEVRQLVPEPVLQVITRTRGRLASFRACDVRLEQPLLERAAVAGLRVIIAISEFR